LNTPPANPYQSPEAAELSDAGAETREPQGYVAHGTFAAVFGVNMIVPLMFGWPMASEHGALGLVLAVAFLLVCGMCVCSLSPKLARAINLGGMIVAASQFIPILHITAGAIGFGLADGLGLTDFGPAPSLTNLGAFVVTAVTGTILIGMSTVPGLILVWLWPGRSRS
jgi:hypothetical protein